MITTNENALNDDLNDQNQGGGSNSFGTADTGDTTNRNYSDDVNADSVIDENKLDDTEGGGNVPGSYSSNESMSGSNSPDDDDDLDLATGDDVPDDDELVDDDDLSDDDNLTGDTESDEDVNTGTTSGNY